MSTARPSPRPKFSLTSEHPPEEVCRRVNEMIQKSESLRGIAFAHRLEIGIDGREHHFFSPQLVVEVTPDGGGSRLAARFGPDPYVWGLYVMGSGALSLATLFSLCAGFGQWTIGQRPTALMAAPAAAVLAGLAYGASYVGQGLGFDQMYSLRHSLEHAVDGRDADPPSTLTG